MAAKALNPAALTLEQVVTEGHRYHPFQLVELLRRLAGDEAPVRIRPSDSLAFPAADVGRVKQRDDDSIDVQVRFDGFYGVDSPLPHYFLEDATVETDYAERIRAFLDLFNLPFYQLRQAVWQASRFYDSSANKLGPLSQVLSQLLPSDKAETDACLQYPGLYLQGQPGQKALAAMLRQLLQCQALELTTDACSWQPLTQPSRLGDRPAINDTLCLGRRVAVRGQLVTIRMGRLSKSEAARVQPGGALSRSLAQALSAALPDDLTWALEFSTQADAKAQQLGRKKLALGRAGALAKGPTNWVGQRYVCSQYRYLII